MRHSGVVVVGVTALLVLAACSHRVSEGVLPSRGLSAASRNPLGSLCGLNFAELTARGYVVVLVPSQTTGKLITRDFPNGGPPYVFGNGNLNVAPTPPPPVVPTQLTLFPGAATCDSRLSPQHETPSR